MLDLESAIKRCEEVADTKEKEGSLNQESFMPLNEFLRYRVECLNCASEYRQLAEWLKELQRYRFEISECKAILDNPTPDVTENDKKRAMFVLQTFPDVRGDEI